MNGKRNEQGMALVFALMAAIVLLGALGVMALRLNEQKTTTDHAYDTIVVEEVAKGGIDMAMRQLWQDYVEGNGNTTGNWASYRFFIANQLGIPNTEDLNGNGVMDNGENDFDGYNGWESWTNVPHERQRMIDLIRKTKANGVLFLSGDVHWGEISKLEVAGGYPLYDVTSSGITQTWDVIEPNGNRIGEAVPQNNIGLVEIQAAGDSTLLILSLYDAAGKAVVKHKVGLAELSF